MDTNNTPVADSASNSQTLSTAVLSHPLATPQAHGHAQFILSLIDGLLQREAPIVLKLVPNPWVQLGIVAGEIGLSTVEAALAPATGPAPVAVASPVPFSPAPIPAQ